MDRKIRTTLVALMQEGMNAEDTQRLIDTVTADEDSAMIHTFYKALELTNGGQRIYAKISKVLNPDGINDEWYHRVTVKLRNEGCTEVAWRVTKLSPEDCESENTTESFPIDLFQDCLEEDNLKIIPQETPVEPLGSDAFWERFDNDS